MYTIRRPRTEDAAAIHDVIVARDVKVLGVADCTLDEVADDLAEPGFDLDTDGWLAHDADGGPLAWAWACANGDSDLVDIDVVVRPGVDGLAERLWPVVLERARELARERGHDGVTVDVGVYRADDAKRALAKEHGFEAGTSFYRMRIDFDEPVEPPAGPPGLTLHTGESEDIRREAHSVQQAGFAEHFGFVEIGYELWHERRDKQSANDWSQLTLARIDGRPAAMLHCNDQFVSDEGCGYVATLAVLPEFRGRGLGRFLLRRAFAADAARGRKGTILHVDSNNVTPALGLYESAGMRSVLIIDVWRRRL
ncbi:GNAT family N-acetyltransferase [Nonomuraea sp. LPB2021202275-12-8]|uniref:GNAT family N-acetyltransferase n=1 Tax=Nonomuraea sp. LPB2021202275-12-8 TaxID=3120159 RepID=UPI00300D331E